MLSREDFVRRALLLPLVVPLMAGALAMLAPDVFAGFAVFLVGSLLYAGASYLVFAAALYWWTRHRPWRVIKRVTWAAPLLFAPLAGLNAAIVMVAGEPPGPAATGEWRVAFFGAVVLAVVFGYVYVVLTFLAERLRRPRAYLSPREVADARARDSAT